MSETKRKYDSTVARIAGNLLSGEVMCNKPETFPAMAAEAVRLARLIVAEVERTESPRAQCAEGFHVAADSSAQHRRCVLCGFEWDFAVEQEKEKYKAERDDARYQLGFSRPVGTPESDFYRNVRAERAEAKLAAVEAQSISDDDPWSDERTVFAHLERAFHGKVGNTFEKSRAESIMAVVREIVRGRQLLKSQLTQTQQAHARRTAALEKLEREIRVVAMVAGQCSVESPPDVKASMAASEADRCSRWADDLAALLEDTQAPSQTLTDVERAGTSAEMTQCDARNWRGVRCELQLGHLNVMHQANLAYHKPGMLIEWPLVAAVLQDTQE